MTNKTINDIDTKTFECLKQKLKSQGMELKDDAGYLSKNGISLDYAYDETHKTLSISSLEVGFPASLVGMNSKKVLDILEKAVEDCRS